MFKTFARAFAKPLSIVILNLAIASPCNAGIYKRCVKWIAARVGMNPLLKRGIPWENETAEVPYRRIFSDREAKNLRDRLNRLVEEDHSLPGHDIRFSAEPGEVIFSIGGQLPQESVPYIRSRVGGTQGDKIANFVVEMKRLIGKDLAVKRIAVVLRSEKPEGVPEGHSHAIFGNTITVEKAEIGRNALYRKDGSPDKPDSSTQLSEAGSDNLLVFKDAWHQSPPREARRLVILVGFYLN